MKKYLQKYMNENIKIITILFLCLMVGLVVGIVTYQFMNNDIKTELCSTLKSTLDITKQEGFEGINVIKNGIIANIVLVLIIYILSITLIAPGALCVLNLLKGFTIGMYIPTIFQILGLGNGFLAFILLVLIPNLIYIPGYIYICTNAIHFHYQLIDKLNEHSKLTLILKESYILIIGFSIIFLSVIIEQFTSLGVIAMYQNMI